MSGARAHSDVSHVKNDLELVWTKDSMRGVRQRYEYMLIMLLNDRGYANCPAACCCLTNAVCTRFQKALISCLNSSNQNEVLAAIMKLNSAGHASIKILSELMEDEFRHHANDTNAILRCNGSVEKMLTHYGRNECDDFITEMMRPVIQEVAASQGQSVLDVSPAALNAFSDEERLQVVPKRVAQVEKMLVLVLDRMEACWSRFPRGACAVSFELFNKAVAIGHTSPLSIVGGFILLRLINPVVISPELHGLLPEAPSPTLRRNLILLSKILQALSNNVLFGEKESHMIAYNPILEEHCQRMQKLYQVLLVDRELHPEKAPFEDVFIEEDSTYSAFDVSILSYKDLAVLHSAIYEHSVELLSAWQANMLSDAQSSLSVVQLNTVFTTLLQKLGSPPMFYGSSQGKGKLGRAIEALEEQPMDEAVLDAVNSKVASITLDSTKLKDFQDLHKQRFFYKGEGLSKTGYPVFYLIVSRTTDALLEQAERIVAFIVHTLGESSMKGPFVIIADITHAPKLSAAQAKFVFKKIAYMVGLFPSALKNNLATLNILHPSAFVKNLLFLGSSFMTPELKQRIVEVESWHYLQDVSAERLAQNLPSETRRFLPRAWKVIKVNARGKKQDRVIKLSLYSILNIDAEGRTILNERWLSEIDEIIATENSTELQIRFSLPSPNHPQALSDSHVGYFPCSKSTAADLRRRSYIFQSDSDRNEFLAELFRIELLTDMKHPPQSFLVLENNEEFVYKLSSDSLMKLRGTSIVEDTRVDHITSVETVREPFPHVRITLSTEDRPRIVRAEKTGLFATAVAEAAKRALESVRAELLQQRVVLSSQLLQDSGADLPAY